MSAPLYRSQTRPIAVVDLPTALRNAVLTHADIKKLKLAATPAWITHRENGPSGTFFGKLLGKRSNSADADAAHHMVLVLHPTHLLVGTSGPVRGTRVLSLPLLLATVTRGSLLASRFKAAAGDAPGDDGLTIRGFPGEHGNPGTYFVGLGPGSDAATCIAAVMAAVTAAKNVASG